jgi:hypothetical protein
VALGAANFLVHSAEGIHGFVVIEFHVDAHRAPAVCRMTVFARNVERAVRATRTLSLPVRGQCE